MSRLVRRVRTGGQTGVDRAALDAAAIAGIPYVGWVPAGGWAEDQPDPPGVLAPYPLLRPTPSADPRQRTAWNVRDADVTLLLVPDGGRGPSAVAHAPPIVRSPGSDATAAACATYGRPLVTAHIPAAAPRDRPTRGGVMGNPAADDGVTEATEAARVTGAAGMTGAARVTGMTGAARVTEEWEALVRATQARLAEYGLGLTVNVAGPRESEWPGAYVSSRGLLVALFVTEPLARGTAAPLTPPIERATRW